MASDSAPLSERVSSFYSQLSTAAKDLNAVSDELGKCISQIDSALKKLNLGITVWVSIRGDKGARDSFDSEFWSEDIGYAKVSGSWGVSLRKLEGDYSRPDQERVEEWLFNDGPRVLRLSAIEKIPELLEKMSNEAVQTTQNIRAKLSEAQAVADAVSKAAGDRIPIRNGHTPTSASKAAPKW